MDANDLKQLIESLTGIVMTSDDLYEHLLEFVSLAFSIHATIQAIQDVQDKRQVVLNSRPSTSYHIHKTTTPKSSRSSSPIPSTSQGQGDHIISHFKTEFATNMNQLDDLCAQIPRKADQIAGDLDNCHEVIRHFKEKLAVQVKITEESSKKESNTSSSVNSPADTGKQIEPPKKGLKFKKRVKKHDRSQSSDYKKRPDKEDIPMLDLSHLHDEEDVDEDEEGWKFPKSISDEQKALVHALNISSTKQKEDDVLPQFKDLSLNDVENYWEAPRTGRQRLVEAPKMIDGDFAKAILACSEEEECFMDGQQPNVKGKAPASVDKTNLYDKFPRSSYMGVGPAGEPALVYSDRGKTSPGVQPKDNGAVRPKSKRCSKAVKYSAHQLVSMANARQSRRSTESPAVSDKFPNILPLHSLDANKTNTSGFFVNKQRTGPEYEDPLEGPSGLCRTVLKEEEEEHESNVDSQHESIPVIVNSDYDSSQRTSCVESMDSSESIEKISETSGETSIESFETSVDTSAETSARGSAKESTKESTETPAKVSPESLPKESVEPISLQYAIALADKLANEAALDLADRLANEEAIQLAIETAQNFARELVEKSAKEFAKQTAEYTAKYIDGSDEEDDEYRPGGLPVALIKSCGSFRQAVANYDEDEGIWDGNNNISRNPEDNHGLSEDDDDAYNYYLPRVGEVYRPPGTRQRPIYIESRPSQIHFGCPPILEDPLEDTSAISASPDETTTNSLQDSTTELGYEQDELDPEFNSCQERSMVVSGIQTLTVSPAHTPRLSDSFRRTQAAIEDAIYNLKVEMMRPTGAIPKRPRHASKKRKRE